MSPSRFIKQARATTKSLLGSRYQEEVEEDPKWPLPLDDISEYTQARLKDGLAFVDHTQRNKKRKISPLSSHCLTLYQSAIKASLLGEDVSPDEYDHLLATIFTYEKDIYTNKFLRDPLGSDICSTMVERLAELRRYEFATRYGDHMQAVCDELKSKVQVEKPQHFEDIRVWNRFWTNINADLKQEHEDWVKWGFRSPYVSNKQVKTTLCVFNACNHMGLSFYHVLQAIQLYAGQNNLFHKSILRYIENGEWCRLAEMLFRDLRDLPVVTPSHLRKNIPVMETIINAIVDEYFIRGDKERPFDPRDWRTREAPTK
ncbi:hypothetical protein AUP68_05220 [Ilyonectria robusta]